MSEIESKIQDKYEKYSLALNQLDEAIKEPIKTDRDRAGVIQTFEFTYEMSWKLLRAIIEFESGKNLVSPRSVFKEAYSMELIDQEDIWISMISNRNLTTHTYNEDTAEDVIEILKKHYQSTFHDLKKKAQEWV